MNGLGGFLNELRKTRTKIKVILLFFSMAEVANVAANQYIYKCYGLEVVHVKCDIGLKGTLRLTIYIIVRCPLNLL